MLNLGVEYLTCCKHHTALQSDTKHCQKTWQKMLLTSCTWNILDSKLSTCSLSNTRHSGLPPAGTLWCFQCLQALSSANYEAPRSVDPRGVGSLGGVSVRRDASSASVPRFNTGSLISFLSRRHGRGRAAKVGRGGKLQKCHPSFAAAHSGAILNLSGRGTFSCK